MGRKRQTDWEEQGHLMGTLTSILIPVYNESRHIRACLVSIPQIGDWPLEVIVVDDQSLDDTHDVVSAAAADMPADIPVRLLRNPVKGKAAAFNLAFSHARGEQFILLGGDDILVAEALPDRIAAVCRPEPALAMSRYRSLSEDPALDGILYPRPGQEGMVAGGASSFNRAFADLYFPIPPELPNEDTWMRAIAILFDVPQQFLPTVGLHYRLHEGNSTGPRRGFSGTDEVLRQRHAAFGLALRRFPQAGTPVARARLERLAKAEALRQSRNWSAILFLRGLGRADRLVMLANCTSWLYRFKSWLLRR